MYGVLQFFQEVTIDIKHSGFDNILTTSFCLCHSMKILIKILFEWIFKIKIPGAADGPLFVTMCGTCYLYGIIQYMYSSLATLGTLKLYG